MSEPIQTSQGEEKELLTEIITVPRWMEFHKFNIHVKYLQAAWMCQNPHLSSQKSKGLLNKNIIPEV